MGGSGSATKEATCTLPPYEWESEQLDQQRESPFLGETGDSFVPLDLSPSWINLDTVRDWIATCISDHGSRCWPLELLGGLPLWLVDVEQLCLVKATVQHTYLALSYVWGQVDCAETTLANLAQFQVPGVFSPANEDLKIPKTVLHAIHLTAMLGQRYIWVDRLCICQDDIETKVSQINIMSDIYNNALTTIIAASGWDANHGLRGIKGVTEPRNLAPNAGDDYFKSIEPQNSMWYTRGWTFQELLFSPRKLMFHYQVAIWQCNCAVRHEIHGSQKVSNIPSANKVMPSHFDRLLRLSEPTQMQRNHWQSYLSLVNLFNSRELTFPEDASRAFSGVVTALAKTTFPGGFLWGLPLDCFDVALLWTSISPQVRRKPKLPASQGIPSWSWMGWSGEIGEQATYLLHGLARPLSQEQADEPHLKPVCEWYCIDNNSTSQPTRVVPGAAFLQPLPYLVTSGQLATFQLGRSQAYGDDFRKLQDKNRHFAGLIDTVGNSEIQRLEAGEECEFLALSKCSGYFIVSDILEPHKQRDYYNVLWVARNGNVLRRKGVAKITSRMWDRAEKTFEVVELH